MTRTTRSVLFGSISSALFAFAVAAGAQTPSVTAGGTPSYSVPIAVPPGVNGHAPSIALVYSGGGRHGDLVGYGWNLSAASAITRCGSDMSIDGTQFSITWEQTDRLCLDGKRLIQVNSSNAPQVGKASNDAAGSASGAYREFRTEEDGFMRIRAYGYADGSTARSGPAFFRVWTKDGDVLDYGAAPTADGNTQGLITEAVPASSGVEKRVYAYAWALARHADSFGNAIDYKYRRGAGTWTVDATQGWTQSGSYWSLREIQYAGNKVLFDTNSTATDDGSISYHEGLKTYNGTRLNSITVYSNAGNTDTLGVTSTAVAVRHIKLSYGVGGVSGRRRLNSIQECAGDSTSTTCLPATTFSYSTGGAVTYSKIAGGLTNYGIGEGITSIRTGDFNGDGRLDIIAPHKTQDGFETYLLLSKGGGTFTTRTPFTENLLSWGTADDFGCRYATVADFNGDGLSDIYVKTTTAGLNCTAGTTNSQSIYFSDGDGTFTKKVITTLPVSLDMPKVTRVVEDVSWTAGGRTVFLDVDGDGKLDALASELPAVSGWDRRTAPPNPCATFECTRFYKGDGQGNFTKTPTNLAQRNVLNALTSEGWNNPDLAIKEDFNADGLSDLVVERPVDIRTATDLLSARSLGDGNFAIDDSAPSCSGFPLDYNGDGRIDCLQKGATEVWLTTGTNGKRTLGQPLPFELRMASNVQVGDFNNDGRSDLFYKDVYLSLGDGHFNKVSGPDLEGQTVLATGDFLGNGNVEILTPYGLFAKTSSSQPDLLTIISSPTGADTTFYYVSIANPVSSTYGARYLSDRGTANAPTGTAVELTPASWVVHIMTEDTGIGAQTKSSNYQYRGFRYDVIARKSLGFREFRQQVVAPNGGSLTNVTEFLQDAPYEGKVKRTATHLSTLDKVASGNELSDTETVYCTVGVSGTAVTTAKTSGVSCPTTAVLHKTYPLQSVSTSKDLTGEPLPTTTVELTVNASGYPTFEKTTTVQTGTLPGTYTKEVTTTYVTDNTGCSDALTCSWVIGRPLKVTERRTSPSTMPTTSAGSAPNATATSGAALSGVVNVTSLSFDKTPYSTPRTLGATVTNTGTTDLTLTVPSAASVTGTDFSFVSTTCTSPLKAGATCVVKVKFTPTSDASRSGSLTVAYTGGTSSGTLSGTGLKPVLALTSGSLAYGDKLIKGSYKSGTVTLTNSGGFRADGIALTAPSGFSVVDSACGASVGAGESCTFKLAFAPTAEVTYSGNLAVTSTSGATDTLAVSGNGVTSALYLADLSFGSVSAATTKVAMLRNATASAITLSAPTIPASLANYPSPVPAVYFSVDSTTCGSSLAAGASCNITVKFDPAEDAPRLANAQLTVATSAGTLTSELSATNTRPSISIVQFEPTEPFEQNMYAVVGQYDQRKWRVINNGNATISSLSITAPAPFSVVSNTCTTALAPNAECTFWARFTPTATGSYANDVTLTPAGGEAKTLRVGGFTTKTNISISPMSIDFGNVTPGQSVTKTITYTNTGTVSAVINSISTDEGVNAKGDKFLFDFHRSSTTCGSSLAAGASCTVNVTFTPELDDGAQNGDWWVYFDNVPYRTIINGVTAAAVFVPSVSVLDFGTQTIGSDARSQLVTLINAGSGKAVTGSNFYTISNSQFSVVDSTCPQYLEAKAQCSFVVLYRPTTAGAVTADMTFSASNAVTKLVTLKGTGAAAAITVTAPAFGTVANPSTKTVAVTVANPAGGTGAVTMVTPSADSLEGDSSFSFVSTTCGTSLADGASCVVNVKHTPSEDGAHAATLSVVAGGVAYKEDLSATSQTTKWSFPRSYSFVNFGEVPVGVDVFSGDYALKNEGSLAAQPTISVPTGFVVTSNTCTTAIAAGAECIFRFRFTPAAAQAYAGQFTVSGGGSTTGLSLSGQGVGAAVTLDDQAYGGVHVGGYKTLGAYLTNNGASAITVTAPTAASVSGTGFSYISTTCPASLAAGASCYVSVRLTPTAVVPYNGTLTLSTSAGAKTATLSGNGVVSTATLSVTSLTWGAKGVGMPSARATATITNTGEYPLTLSSISLTAGATDWTLTDDCGATLEPGDLCTLTMIFKPTAVGTRTGTVTVVNDGSTGNVTIALAGTGRTPYTTMPDLAFGTVTAGSTKTLNATLTNSGAGDVTVTAPVATNVTGTGFSFTSTTCGGTLAPGASCTVAVKYAPIVAGAATGALKVYTSEGYQEGVLTGTGAGISLALTPSTLSSFGSVQTGSYKTSATLTLKNSGAGTASALAITVPTGYSLVSNTCGSTLAAGASCTFAVRFSPTASQAYNGTLSVTSTTAGINSDSLSLSGTGQAPSATVTNIDFGTVLTYTNTQKSATLTNTGVGTLTLTTPSAASYVSGSVRFYFVSTTCGTSLAAGASCTITMQYSPVGSIGTVSGTLHVSTSAGTKTSVVSGTSRAPAPNLTFSPADIDTYSYPSEYSDTLVTVKNVGDGALASMSLTVEGTNLFSLQSNTCGTSLAVGASCTFKARLSCPGGSGGQTTDGYVTAGGTGYTKYFGLHGYCRYVIGGGGGMEP